MARVREFQAELARHRTVGLDTSFLIYHLEGVSPYADLTEATVRALAQGGLSAVVSAISVTELLTKPFADGEEERAEACAAFLLGLPHTQVIAPDFRIAHEAARLRARHGLRTPDALIVATCVAEGATALLANDRRLKKAKPGNLTVLFLDDYVTKANRSA